MTNNPHFDVIIIGGSYSGLAAGMSLGRALRKVLIIDGGNPCNKQTPHSHNFLTQDGQTPAAIASLAKEQVEKYKTVTFRNDLAVSGLQTTNGFEIATQSGSTFSAKKLIFATGIKDVMPEIEGFSDCWGVSVIHCPYCHGYEYSNEKTGILTNGDVAYEVSRLISNWTKDLTVFTNGIAEFAPNQTQKLSEHGIMINESVIDHFEHNNGYLRNIVFKDGSKTPITAIYARPEFEQHCAIPEQLGCELTEQGHISVDPFQKTTIRGVFACGDNTTFMRSVANSVAMGTLAGVMTNKEIIEDEF
ncbi:MAG: pyridine nucleotide-disulfide oxidoreductase [Candidatus Fluviicola riflensis]|nr:MAG: pyridine nucleotide-disulfide oxidoreductase [Candidatus Fluviicola riflensis]OGS80079.1 MAG: pyridine nucleotide-disulfide oxidoreductase [Candidatus Fluviicola riflensis]OGS87251.1 MAG: pyridine nucleotide-disulfide oxidoreductase [Fluviicola sp. RIFCSPHIGHO2_01_FULL_43_53]OGS88993.1 MAG: pyridine nucleotide-disulfide oxidoreductase [Fluviicola sp. RIFCSPHIGHO2_12_FULL_43_24]